MDKTILESLVTQGLSLSQIGKEIGICASAVRYRLKKYGLRTVNNKPAPQIPYSERMSSNCAKCKLEKPISQFYKHLKHGKQVPWSYCRSCCKEDGLTKRKHLKEFAITYKGGKCIKCGYDRCNSALDFHHLNPSEKDHEINVLLKAFKDETVLMKELDKCVLLCSNCHREFHAGFITL